MTWSGLRHRKEFEEESRISCKSPKHWIISKWGEFFKYFESEKHNVCVHFSSFLNIPTNHPPYNQTSEALPVRSQEFWLFKFLQQWIKMQIIHLLFLLLHYYFRELIFSHICAVFPPLLPLGKNLLMAFMPFESCSPTLYFDCLLYLTCWKFYSFHFLQLHTISLSWMMYSWIKYFLWLSNLIMPTFFCIFLNSLGYFYAVPFFEFTY